MVSGPLCGIRVLDMSRYVASKRIGRRCLEGYSQICSQELTTTLPGPLLLVPWSEGETEDEYERTLECS